MTELRTAVTAHDLDTLHLERGAHDSREEGMCLLEAVAWVAGEPHTDSPACVCHAVTVLAGATWSGAA